MRFRSEEKLFRSNSLYDAGSSEIRGPRSRPVLDKIRACRTRETASTSGARSGSAAQASIYYGGDRRQRTEFLCKLDEKHRSKTCRPGEQPRVDTSLTEEQIGRRFGRTRKFVRDLIDNNFPSWDDYRRRRSSAFSFGAPAFQTSKWPLAVVQMMH
jgi:hypothetical protein